MPATIQAEDWLAAGAAVVSPAAPPPRRVYSVDEVILHQGDIASAASLPPTGGRWRGGPGGGVRQRESSRATCGCLWPAIGGTMRPDILGIGLSVFLSSFGVRSEGIGRIRQSVLREDCRRQGSLAANPL
jgi:hypothetical protein